MARGYVYVAERGLFNFGLWMQLYKCSEKAVLMFAPRICRAQVLGNQVWYVAPNGKWAEFWCQDLSACNKMAEGEEAETVLLYACCGIRRRKVKGVGGGSGAVPNRKREARGPMPPWGSMVKGSRIVLLLLSAAITCSPSTYEVSVLMLDDGVDVDQRQGESSVREFIRYRNIHTQIPT